MDSIDKLIVKLDNLQKIDIDKTLEKACILVENDAKTKVPVDTGQLRNSITHEVNNGVGLVGTNTEYAPYVEFGTGLFAVNGDGRKDVPWRYQDADGSWHTTSGEKPQPYLQPALDENRTQVVNIFKQEIEKELKK